MVMGHHQQCSQESTRRSWAGETPQTSISSGLRESIQRQLNDLGVPDLQDTPELDSLLGAAPWRGSVPAGGKHWVLWESNRDEFCVFSPQRSPVLEQQNPAEISNLSC